MTDYLSYRRKLKLEGPQPKPKKVYKIKTYSDKRSKLNREYAKKTKPLWKDQPCAAGLPGCTKIAQGMHHLQGKETTEKLLNTEKMIPCCNACNSWVEKNDAEARRLGLKESKFKN